VTATNAEGCLKVSPDKYRLVAISGKGRKVMLRKAEGFLIAWSKDTVNVQRVGR